jgi:hypothetical protein
MTSKFVEKLGMRATGASRDFRIEVYLEIVAMAKVEDGAFLMRHALRL